MAALVIENFDGEASFKSWRQGKVSNITSQPDGSIYVPAADTTSVSRVFSSRLSYNKGSMALHMLRRKLGDATFFQGLQEYLADSILHMDMPRPKIWKPPLESVVVKISPNSLTIGSTGKDIPATIWNGNGWMPLR